MLKVASVLRSGGIYNADWAARLAAGVAKHLPVPHKFVCLSDVDVPCSRIPLEHDWLGWWAKIELFKLPPPVLYFDLDTLIVGDLSNIVKAMRGFVMLRDFYDGKHKGSGVMAWSTGSGASSIYEKFKERPAHFMDQFRSGGDQRFIESVMPDAHCWQDVVPSQIVSYKVDKCEIKAPDSASVVCLHGQPKFSDMAPTSWARTMWEKAA